MAKYEDKDAWNRVQTLRKLARFVEKRAKSTDTYKTIIKSLGMTSEMEQQFEDTNKHRCEILPDTLNDIISIFTDCEFGNYYNMDRVLQGKVKLFQGDNPKARLLAALEEAEDTHIWEH